MTQPYMSESAAQGAARAFAHLAGSEDVRHFHVTEKADPGRLEAYFYVKKRVYRLTAQTKMHYDNAERKNIVTDVVLHFDLMEAVPQTYMEMVIQDIRDTPDPADVP
jgi:hypothetical protein